jgi:hypothetical protein
MRKNGQIKGTRKGYGRMNEVHKRIEGGDDSVKGTVST